MPGCGIVVIDIDIKSPDARCDPFEVLYRFYDDAVFQVQSGSGYGQHWWFACPLDDLPSKANAVLAKSERLVATDDGKTVPEWTIEVLSTGKQLVAPPSIHPDTGAPYRWVTPLDTALPRMPANILSAIKEEPSEPVRVVNVVPASRPSRPPVHFEQPDSIADRFRVVSWASVLEPHGWQFVRQQGATEQWVRPGKNPRDGISATTRDDVFYCFTSSTVFEPERGYSKFQTYAILEHGGDMSQAAKHLITVKRDK
jgi:hypothetical protein